jgi:sugar O-acyltransferase (sialic acid O-acetyltransferase NeuD family)
MSKVVVFGTGSFAECVHFYLTHDSEHEVVAFTVHRDHLGDTTELAGLPVVAFEDLEQTHPPADHDMFVAVGYAKVNRVRAAICDEAKAKGYALISYVSSKATTWGDTRIGENCFVFEDNTIQPFVTIGDDCVLWSGNHIGHHATIGDHCFITSHVVVSGHVTIGSYSFLGVNATFRDAITVGEANVVGAGALIMKSTKDAEVYIAPRTKADGRASDQIGM